VDVCVCMSDGLGLGMGMGMGMGVFMWWMGWVIWDNKLPRVDLI
jgi:hypothetical protein